MSVQTNPTTSSTPSRSANTTAPPIVRPLVDVFENGCEILILADVPGARADDLSIHLDRGMLVVEATGSFRLGDGSLVACEFAPVRYRRALRLQAEIDVDGITASLKDGLLSVRLPRAEAAKPRKIDVIEG
jgi:HSP20 family protein